MEDQSILVLCVPTPRLSGKRHGASGERQVLFSFFFSFSSCFGLFLFDNACMRICMSDELNMLNIIDYFLNASGHLYINDIQGYSIYRKLYHFP